LWLKYNDFSLIQCKNLNLYLNLGFKSEAAVKAEFEALKKITLLRFKAECYFLTIYFNDLTLIRL